MRGAEAGNVPLGLGSPRMRAAAETVLDPPACVTGAGAAWKGTDRHGRREGRGGRHSGRRGRRRKDSGCGGGCGGGGETVRITAVVKAVELRPGAARKRARGCRHGRRHSNQRTSVKKSQPAICLLWSRTAVWRITCAGRRRLKRGECEMTMRLLCAWKPFFRTKKTTTYHKYSSQAGNVASCPASTSRQIVSVPRGGTLPSRSKNLGSKLPI